MSDPLNPQTTIPPIEQQTSEIENNNTESVSEAIIDDMQMNSSVSTVNNDTGDSSSIQEPPEVKKSLETITEFSKRQDTLKSVFAVGDENIISPSTPVETVSESRTSEKQQHSMKPTPQNPSESNCCNLQVKEVQETSEKRSLSGFANTSSENREWSKAERKYTRNELESLRFLNNEEQNRIWNVIYLSLGPVAGRLLDEMSVDCIKPQNHRQHKSQNNQAQSKNQNQQGQRKGQKHNGWKRDNVPILAGEVFDENREHTYEKQSIGEEFSHDMNRKDPNRLHLPVDNHDAGEDNDYTMGEDDWNDEIESDDEYNSIQRPAFLVEGDPNFESGPPQDGLEYLRRVRWEAAQIPKVKVARLDRCKLKDDQTVYMPKIPDIAKCPQHLLPSNQWEDAFLADFSKLRLDLTHLESLKFQDSNSTQRRKLTKEGDSCCFSSDPKVSVVLRMDAVSRKSTLKSHIRLLEPMTTLSRNVCAWIFSLCAAVDTPLDADTGASLRCLLRKCAELRARKSEYDDEVVMLNILATICGRYFKQLD